MAQNCLMPWFTFLFHKKSIFCGIRRPMQEEAEKGSECICSAHTDCAADGARAGTHTHKIDSPWLLQSDQFCIQCRPRVNLLLLGNFLAEREMDPLWQSPGFQSDISCRFWLIPFHSASPEGKRAPDLGPAGSTLRVTRMLLALWHFPEALFGAEAPLYHTNFDI